MIVGRTELVKRWFRLDLTVSSPSSPTRNIFVEAYPSFSSALIVRTYLTPSGAWTSSNLNQDGVDGVR